MTCYHSKDIVAKQPFYNIVLWDCEIKRYHEFLKDHKHSKAKSAAIEEDCAPMGFYKLHYSTTSISWDWVIECTFCKQTRSLSVDIDW